MKIVKLTAENVKRLVAVEIEPEGNLVQITGGNGAGKTSVLDSIWWALGGSKNHQAKPIRDGETEARITLDLGELIVRREFRETDAGKLTTRVLVESAEGARFPSPQKMLDGLLDTLTFDPLTFARMPAAAQYDSIQSLCGLDFAEQERAIAAAYDRRRDANRIAKDLAAQAQGITIPDTEGLERVELADLTAEVQAAEASNRARNDQLRERQKLESEADRQSEIASNLEGRIQEYRQRIDVMVRECEGAKRAAQDRLSEVLNLPPIQDAIDTAELYARMGEVVKTNRRLDMRDQAIERRQALTDRAEAHTAESKRLSAEMDRVKAEMRAQIEAADMPLEGMSLAAGVVTLDGIPFEQLSDAEQLRASTAIAMRSNADLRILRIRDGSLLDSGSLRAIEEMADAHDYQVWIERVDESGKIGFVIEDGQIAS